jgi:4-carboxymuconolactone decarboxylase
MTARVGGHGLIVLGFVEDHRTILRKLAIRDVGLVDEVIGHDRHNLDASGLDPKTHALVRIGALITIDAGPASYLWSVESALQHGATLDEIVGTLLAVLAVIGPEGVVCAAPKLGLAVGYDVSPALGHLGDEERRAMV